MSDKIGVIIGYSGHAYVVAEAAREMGIELRYYSDKKKNIKNPFELSFLGDENDEGFQGWNGGFNFILGSGDNQIRERIAERISEKEESILTVIHPSASVSKAVEIGIGVFISRNASVNPLSKIGKYSIINTNAVVEHECILGTAVHIAPGAVLAGNVEVGDRSFIGANSVVKQGITIGKNVIVGAGSVVLQNIPDNVIIAGNPSRQIR